MRVFILVMYFSLVAELINAQNLVPNPSFEDTLGCPNWYNQLDSTSGWFNPNMSSPDYYNTCSTNLCNSLDSYTGYQYPHSGEAYAGIIIWDNLNSREYLEIELVGSLKQKNVITLICSLTELTNHN